MSVKSLSDLALAVRTTLETHLPAHLAALARPLPAPSSWELVPTEDNIRRVNGVIGGVSFVATRDGSLRREGNGSYSAWCVGSVFLFHQHSSATPVDLAPGDYATALAECLDHHSSLDGFASGIDIEAIGANVIGDALSPSTLGYASVDCAFQVKDFITRTPHGNPVLGTVLTTDTTVTRL